MVDSVAKFSIHSGNNGDQGQS